MSISPAQVKGARGLLGWSQETLAVAAGVSTSSVKAFEHAKKLPLAGIRSAIQLAFEDAGVEFSVGEPGARMRSHRTLPAWSAIEDYSPVLDPIAKEHLRAASRAVSSAFEAGREVGRRETEVKFREQLGRLLKKRDGGAALQTMVEATPSWAPDIKKRARRGTVRPAIIAALELTGSAGSTAEQLFECLRTGGLTTINEKSIRTILRKMTTEGSVQKGANGWVIATS
jgi:transcriptional regulator with XRE-family HTH domain